MEVDKSMLESLTEEERRLVEQAGSPKDLVELAQKSGVTLTDEQLDAIAGGGVLDWDKKGDPLRCPNCGSTKIKGYFRKYKCGRCHHQWAVMLPGSRQ